MTERVAFRLYDEQIADPPESITDVRNGSLEIPIGFSRAGPKAFKKYLHGDVVEVASRSYIILQNMSFRASMVLKEDEAKRSNRWVLEDIDTGTTFRIYSRYFYQMMAATPVQFDEPIHGLWTCTIHGSKFGIRLIERE